MASKKAAKKFAKAAKKTPGHKRGQDLRRCFEHFGRVSTVLPLLQETDTVTKMASLAQSLLEAGQVKDAADVLRAAEHLSFGSLAVQSDEAAISPTLAEALEDEYRHLVDRAEHQAANLAAGAVERLFTLMKKQAAAAFKAKKLRAASELARGAEALTHVTAEVTARLRSVDLRELQGSLLQGELPR